MSLVPAADARVMTWNIEGIGSRNSVQYKAALAVLRRIDADVVALNEVDNNDITALQQLAADAGYPHVVVPATNPFGPDRNAFLSRFPILEQKIHTSAALSGDPSANDIARLIVEITVDVPGASRDLTLLVEHWKAGFSDADEFRRACESFRIAGALATRSPATDAYVVMGDVNFDIDTQSSFPAVFTQIPSGMPSSFSLGSDLEAELLGGGLVNDPFFYLTREEGPRLEVLDALQLDASDATRPTSGRRIDYIMVSPALAALSPRAEVYDSRDEGRPGGLPKAGDPLLFETSANASDHLPVFADLTLSSEPEPSPLFWMAFKSPVSLPGIGTVQNEDIVVFDPSDGSWSLAFDGSDLGLGSVAIDGLALLPSGEILLSFDQPISLPGIVGAPSDDSLVADSDIVLFAPTSLGPDTQGTLSFFLDGSDLGLTTNDEDIDAIALDLEGRLILSTLGNFSAFGLSGADEDLFLLDPETLGANTAGSLFLLLDGSDVGLTTSGEDTDAVAIASGGALVLSTTGDVSVPGVIGGDDLLFQFIPDSLGSESAGEFFPFFDPTLHGLPLDADVNALEIVR